MSEDKSRQYRRGMETRRAVLGQNYVERTTAAGEGIDAPFQELLTEAAWGHVWSRGTIPQRERSMMTIALLAGLGNFEELALHARATANTGTSREDVMEAMLHVAIYAGIPRANHAIKVVKKVFEEMDAEAGR